MRMYNIKAFHLRIHEKAELSYNEFDNRLELKLTNKETGQTSEKTYYKINEGITITEAMKIDTIIYFMHNDIGLNLWGSKEISR